MTSGKEVMGFFKSERLLYRAVEDSNDDKVFFHKYIMNDPVHQVFARSNLRRPYTEKAAQDFVKKVQDAIISVVICLPKNKHDLGVQADESDSALTPIGFMSLSPNMTADVFPNRNAMLGISLLEDFRGKGYGGEAINWVLDWAFRTAGLHRVNLVAFSYNTNALKLYRKLGFVDEGREREAIYHDRAWHDLVHLAMLEHEWESLRARQQPEVEVGGLLAA